MTITLFIIGYIASVFLCRWLNKISSKIDPIGGGKVVFLWLIPLMNIVAILSLIIYIIIYSNFFKWFRGDHW